MADNNNEVEVKVKVTGTEQLKGLSSELAAYKTNLNAAEKANLSIASSALTAQQRIEELKRAARIQEIGTQFGEAAKGVDDTTVAVKALVAQLEKLGASKQEIIAASEAFQRAKVNAQALQASGDDSGGGGLNLGRIGGQLRSLPSTAIPGTGLTTDAVANVIRLGGALQQVGSNSDGLAGKAKEAAQAIGYGNIGMVGGIAIMIGVLKVFSDQAEKARAAAQTEIEARQKAIGLLATGTKEAEQARINELAAERKKNEAIAADANNQLNQLRIEIDARGKNQLALTEFNSNMRTGAGELTAAKEAADKANKALSSTTTELDLLQQGTGLVAQTATEAADAEKKLNDERARVANQIRAFEAPLDKSKEIDDFLKDATTKQLEDKKKAVQEELNFDNAKIQAITALRDSEKQGTQAYIDFDNEIKNLRQGLFLDTLAMIELSDATAQAAAKENDLKAIREDQIQATAKYVEATKKLEDDKNQALNAAAKKYGDTLVTIADTAAKSAEDALRKLGEKRADLATSFANTQTDAETKARYKQQDDEEKFRRDDAKAARDHANDLLKIQKDQAEKEADLVLARDFAGLYAFQRDKNKQIEAANTAYDTDRQNRIDAYTAAQDDQAEAFKRDEEQRQLNYKRQQDQAQLAYNREQSQIARNYADAYQKAVTNYTNEQNLLNQKYISQQNMLNQSITAQLQQQAAGDQAKLQLEAQYYARSQELIKGIYSNGGTTVNGIAPPTGGGSGTGGGAVGYYSNLDTPRPNVSSQSSSSVNNNNSRNVNLSLSQSITGGKDSGQLASLIAQMVEAKVAELVNG